MQYKILLRLFSTLISLLISFQYSSAQVVEEQFAVVDGEFENGVKIIGTINMAYKEFQDKRTYPWCLHIVVELDQDSLFVNKLPLRSESTLAYALEDELVAGVKKIATTQFIGHVFYDGMMDIFLYLKAPEVVNQYLQIKTAGTGHVRGYSFEISEDPEWLKVASYLK